MAEDSRRDAEAFLRGPVGFNTFAYGTDDAYRAGVQHHKGLTFPEPADGDDDEFGIAAPGTFTVEIADEGDSDWFLLWDDGTYVLWDDGTRIVLEY